MDVVRSKKWVGTFDSHDQICMIDMLLVVLALLSCHLTSIVAYREGEFVPMARKSQYDSVRPIKRAYMIMYRGC